MASAPPDRIVCPFCEQGWVLPVRINAFGFTAWLCEECDALWQTRQKIGRDTFISFEFFMKVHGRPGLWSEVTVLQDGGETG